MNSRWTRHAPASAAAISPARICATYSRLTGLRLQISVLLGHFVGSMVITSLALRIFYGYPWATLAVRIPNALILAAVNTVLLRILLENRTLMKMVKK